MTYLEAKAKIEKERLTRLDVSMLAGKIPMDEWTVMRGVINDLESEKVNARIDSLIDITEELAKKINRLESNHLEHIQKDIEVIKRRLGL